MPKKFDFVEQMGTVPEDEKAEIEIKFWSLSKSSRLHGLGSGQARDGFMCRRCGSVVGDVQQHAIWHRDIEGIEVSRIEKTANWQ